VLIELSVVGDVSQEILREGGFVEVDTSSMTFSFTHRDIFS
jgi:hypothetical protein